MDKSLKTDSEDISTAPYRGTGPYVASAGYMYISHFFATIIGVIGVGAAAYFAHAPINRWITSAREYGSRIGGWRKTSIQWMFGAVPGSHELNELTNSLGSVSASHREKLKEIIAYEEQGFFEATAVKVAKLFSKSERATEFLEKQSSDKLTAAFIGGGLGGAVGWIGTTFWSVYKGGHESSTGKQQFQSAQTEIKNLRERNEVLARQNTAMEKKLEKIDTVIDREDATPATSLNHAKHEGNIAPSHGHEAERD